MERTIDGDFRSIDGFTVAVVAARFNSFIVDSLLAGARDVLRRHFADDRFQLDVVWVPGALEIPYAAALLAKKARYDAIVALGAVIRGATPHFDIVAGESAKGLSKVSLEHGVPVINGILTTNTIEQAIERAGTKAGNKGAEAMLGAIEMASLTRKLHG